MAHLTCQTHGRRALVIEPATGPLTKLIHRQDGSHCGDMGFDFVKYRGHVRTSFTVLSSNLPKFQAPSRNQIKRDLDLIEQMQSYQAALG